MTGAGQPDVGTTLHSSGRPFRRTLPEHGLAGGGEMGAAVRTHDWASTPIGPIEAWPQSLRTAVSVLLASGYPMYLAWGPEYVQFYNDAYRPILGSTKHPGALGQATPECFAEIWEIIGPMFAEVREGRTHSYDDFLLPLDRHGYVEECYFDFSYSPIRDESGGVGGVFVTCSETTGRVVGERRLRTLRELGTRTRAARSGTESATLAAEVLGHSEHDLPFALIYRAADGAATAERIAHTGQQSCERIAPLSLDVGAGEAPLWPVGEALRTGRAIVVDDVGERCGEIVLPPWSEPITTAVVVPLTAGGEIEGAAGGVLVAGVSPRRQLDDDYRGFLEVVARQVASGMAGAHALHTAVARAESLAELDRAKTVFFNDISHEFRTPLTLSMGPLDEILDDPSAEARLSDADRGRLGVVRRNNLRLLRLVNSLLDFARIEAGRVQAALQPLDLTALCEDVVSVFRSAVEGAGLQLDLQLQVLPRPVMVDPEMWEKVLANLLSNALKFTFSGGITVSVAAGPQGAVVDVRDTGVGIPAAELDRIFERFHRVRGMRSRTHEGAGIGLSLVRELVLLQGGSIRVESAEGRGTQFTIELPWAAAGVSAARLPESEAALRRLSEATVDEAGRWRWSDDPDLGEPVGLDVAGVDRRTAGGDDVEGAGILVVDDNADMRDYLARLLRETYRVRLAPDGDVAVRSATEEPPDLIVLDAMMPRRDGLEVLRALREQETTRNVPVVMLSARAGEEATIEGFEAGADDYLTKPFSPRELLTRVRSVLRMARARTAAADAASRLESARAAQARALDVLEAVARHVGSQAETAAFFAGLTETIAALVHADRVAFWLLSEDGHTVTMQLPSHGFPADTVAAVISVPVTPDGSAPGDVLVYGAGSLPPTGVSDARFDAYREWIRATGVRDVMATAWKAGAAPLGVLAAYDATQPGGFSAEDVWVLEVAAVASALVWQHERAGALLEELRIAESSRLRAEVEQLTRLERLKADFLNLASHELRGPLGLLRGYFDVIRSGAFGHLPEALTHAHTIMSARTDEMTHMVEQMLETARIDDNRLALKRRTVDLRSIVTDAVDRIRPLAAADQSFDVVLPEAPVQVAADPERIRDAILNLVSNAQKFSTNGGAIRVRCAEAGGFAVVRVDDEGIGIDSEEMDRLFTRFGRLVNADNSHIPGTGLGLYLTREIARMHGGDVELESTRRQGTTATLRLPLAPRV